MIPNHFVSGTQAFDIIGTAMSQFHKTCNAKHRTRTESICVSRGVLGSRGSNTSNC